MKYQLQFAARFMFSERFQMKAAMLFLVFSGLTFAQTTQPGKATSGALRIEVRTSSARVRMNDEMVVTVVFRSPEKDITIWNALGWGAPTGLHLQISDSSGHEVRNDFVEMFHPLPPDRTGRNALMSIGGESFAGFDSQIQAKTLFPEPGRYTIKCLYHPPLPRDYFQGHTIWGKEDGRIESAPASIYVDK